MSQSTPQIPDPSTARIASIGGAAAVSAFLWIAAIMVAQLVPHDVPEALWQLMLAWAATFTMVAVILGITYALQRAVCRNQRAIVTAIGELAAQQEQISAKIDTADRWEIYTKAASDLLGDRDRRQ